MSNWTESQKNNFIHHYQSLGFKENNPDPHVKCHFKRQSLSLLLSAAQETTCNETTCLILRRKLQDYSSIVDKPEGVNNYASGVLDIVSNTPTEVQKWRSKAKASELLKEFLKPSAGECYQPSPDGCLAQKPTNEQLKGFFSNRKPFPTTVTTSTLPTPQENKIFTAANSNVIPKAMNVESCSVRAQPSSSRVMNAIESRVFGSNKVGSFNQTPNQPPAKPQPSASTGFRTAGTELKLQNAKKFGQKSSSSSSGGCGGDSLNYGSNKKSLGGRSRPVNSKFVPPVKSNSQEAMECDSCGEGEGEVEDERLRLIDPKIVELVRSEIMDHGPPVSWDHIAGLHFAKATIQEIVVLPMLRPDIFTGLRRPPKGILLFGPPGTGKTLIGKCIASQSKSTFFNISASSLTSKWVGEGEKMVRTLFTLARIHQPAVVFIDEIDSLLSQRSDSEHESSRRIKTEFLVQLDGAGTGEEDRILVIGATNRPQELDEAARRRLVKRLYIPLPDTQARRQMVQLLMSGERNTLSEPHMDEIASLTQGYSGADMKTLCQEACLGPIRSLTFTEMQQIAPHQVRQVTLDDFKSALSCVRSSVSPSDLDAYVSWDQTYGSGGAPK